MTPPLHLSLSVTVYDGATPVLLVAGIPGHPEEVAFLVADGVVRTLRPVRGIPARLPDRPITPDLPSLAAILRGAAAPSEEEQADVL
ncbi:hypothetical protein HL658_09900, partial [Azospirillum sp. RWY-5-1]|uniref:Uncharacterized protein n=1 Tax=Azospirillum oleiclasticum TaxID=2735135 RepID=A0ABX2T6R9_9PROT|nr:hypothetical protein [Azospirillum oleiclasticum]NYZ12865.1 hypothetical protein [Azospirillum oleiclasticum]NYZ20025.1 hypothetical protein [Azospirillum oleiclasticum]